MATEPVAPDPFAEDDFWETNKNKIIGYGAAFLLLVGGWGIYQFQQQAKTTASELAYATASTEEEFLEVATKFANTPAGGNASIELANKLRSEGKYDEAVSVLREFIAKDSRHPLLSGAWTSLAATVELQNKPDEALTIYQEIVTKFPQTSAAALALSSQGRLLAAKGDVDAATRAYQDLTVRYPDSLFAMEARRELQLLGQKASPQAAATPEAAAPVAPPPETTSEEAPNAAPQE